MSGFKRENRYVVLKDKDIAMLPQYQREQLKGIQDSIDLIRAARGKQALSCAVIESTKPEYETVWGLIAARLSNAVPSMEAASAAANAAATRTLAYLGYTYEGGEHWKPPLGTSDDYNRGYARGHLEGNQQLLIKVSEILAMWSKPHRAVVGIDTIILESKK